MAGLWTEDIDGEKWLVNPQLIVANPRPKPKRRKKKMASRRKRRQPAGLRKYWAARRGRKSSPRRRRAKKNYTSAGMLVNPRRRRRARRSIAAHRRRGVARRVTRRARRHYARNPQLLGFTMPAISDVLFTAAGMIAPPMVTTYVMKNFIPAAYQASRPVYYAVKAASVLIPSYVVRRFVSPRAGNLVLLGGVASLAIDLIKEFAPGVIPGLGAQPFLGFYENVPMRPSLGGGMGRYLGPGNQGAGSRAPSQMIVSTPDRLDPANRF